MIKLNDTFLKTVQMCGETEALKSSSNYLIVSENEVLDSSFEDGIETSLERIEGGVKAKVLVKKGFKFKNPFFFCFGVESLSYRQQIIPEIILEENSEIMLHSHCSFPNSEKVIHEMEGSFNLGKGAKMTYLESHFHGQKKGANVFPKLKIEVDEGAEFVSKFNLSKGNVGNVKIELNLVLGKNSKADIESKVLGRNANDKIEIIDKVCLKGENAKSVIKMRAAAKDGGTVLMQGETYADAAGAVGHIDCQEIVIGEGSVAKAIPIVEVSNSDARVTHEASVGKINQKELETLMTRGLDEDSATEMIVNAMMR